MPVLLVAAALGVFVAGAVNGMSGLGFAILSGAALALILDAKTAVIMLSVIVPLLNSAQLFRHRREVKHVRRMLPLFAGAILGVPLGVYLLAILPVKAITVLLGAFTVLYAVSGFAQLRFQVSPRSERWLSPVVGFIGGTSSGAIGVAGPLLASYLLALGLTSSAFVFSLALMFVTNTGVRLVGLVALEQLTPGILGLALLLTVPGALGQATGMWLQKRLSRQTFQRGVLAVLLVAGLNLMYRGLS